MTNDNGVEDFLICILTMGIPSFVRYLVRSFAYIFIDVFSWVIGVLYIFWLQDICQMCVINTVFFNSGFPDCFTNSKFGDLFFEFS